MSSKSKWKPKIEFRDPMTLVPFERNINVHTKAQIDSVAGSISNFQFDVPIVVDAHGVIIKGHARREAAISLGLKEVPVIVADHLTEDQVRASRIADKKVSEAPWDTDMLKFELGALDMSGFDLKLTGFELPDLKGFLEEGEIAPQMFRGDPVASTDVERAPIAAVQAPPSTEPLPGEDNVPDSLPTVVKRGEIWTLGRHRLMCGDSTDAAQVAKLMNGEKADMVFTDPPYGMGLDTDFNSMTGIRHDGTKLLNTKGGKRHRPVAGDNDDFKSDLINTVFAAFPEAKEVFLWGADYYAELLPSRNDGSWVVWDKRSNEGADDDEAASADRAFGSAFELCWSKTKHKRELVRLRNGIFGVKNEAGNSKTVHPTQKPVQLAERFLERWGTGYLNIADIYGGSGSTLIACEKTNRRCFMMELDPYYCTVILRRWAEFTGEDPVRSDGVKFSDLLEASNVLPTTSDQQAAQA